MKVSVLPWVDIGNYGSMLQIFAINRILEKYSDSVEVINYMQNSSLRGVLNLNPAKFVNNLITFLFLRNNLRKVKPYLNLTKNTYSSENDFKGFQANADIYCTGSDQIWNTNYGSSVFGPRFLDFLPENKRRFAFSSSFGDRISDENIEKSKELIDRFDRIAVREDVGLKILNEQYEYHKAIQLIDPTLALTPEYWRSLSGKPRINYDYIFVYDLMNSKSFFDYARALSKRTGLPIIHLCHRTAQAFSCGKSIMFPPIFDFVNLVDNARYVLTGSFHATAFALNLNTEPICAYHSRNPSRLASILRLVDAENLAIADFNDFNVINRPINFANINNTLSRERKRVYRFLDEVFDKGSDA